MGSFSLLTLILELRNGFFAQHTSLFGTLDMCVPHAGTSEHEV
jgi:hypothetical protein